MVESLSLVQKENFSKNITYLSCLYDYNTERRFIIKKYILDTIKTGSIFDNKIEFNDVKHFVETQSKKREESGLTMLNQIFYTAEFDAPTMVLNRYIQQRYGESTIENTFFERYKFRPSSLFVLEALIKSLVRMFLQSNGISKGYQFKSKNEYVDLTFIADAPARDITIFNNIIINEDTTVDMASDKLIYDLGYAIINSGVPYAKEATDSLQMREYFKKEVKSIISEISIDLDDLYSNKSDIDDYTFIKKPFVTCDGRLYPIFLEDLATSTHFRIEYFYSKDEQLSNLHDNQKGKIVESFLPGIAHLIGSKNFVRNINFEKDGSSKETDGILIFENSIWAVEIKAHPLLRNYLNKDKVALLETFLTKVKEAYNQGSDILDYLKENPQIRNFLSSNKELKLAGVIVLLDGFTPNLFFNNERVDALIGTSELDSKIKGRGYRLEVLNLIDFSAISLQPENNRFEEFILWRTESGFPVMAFDERDTWAFRFDFYENSKGKESFQIAKDKGITINYISERFNRKDYLPNNL